MIQRLYVHNFRCLENFEISLAGISSGLLIGKNGSGKSTISSVLTILQCIGRGVNRVGELVKESDFTRGNRAIPMRIEIEVIIHEKKYKYVLALDFPDNFTELRVLEEALSVDGVPIYSRKLAKVTLYKSVSDSESVFSVDWHLVALSVIQKQLGDALYTFEDWLGNMLILAPIPANMRGESNGSTLRPKQDVSNFGEWFTGLLLRSPAAYSTISQYIENIMPDFEGIENALFAKDARNLTILFRQNEATFSVEFSQLSDGEKCFLLCALVLAANKYHKPLFCFWDEPDNNLSLSETGHFIMELRRSFKTGGQLLVTSHNTEAIRSFPHENIFVLDRKSHLEPTLIQPLPRIDISGDLIRTLIDGNIEL